ARITEACRQMPHHDSEQTGIPWASAQGSVEAGPGCTWSANARVNRPSVVVASRIGFHAPSLPLCCARQAIEVGMANDRVYVAHSLDQRLRYHLWTRAMLSFG